MAELSQYLVLHARSLHVPPDNTISCLCVLLPFAQILKGGAFSNRFTEVLGFDLVPSASALFCGVFSQGSPHTVSGEGGLHWTWGPRIASDTPYSGAQLATCVWDPTDASALSRVLCLRCQCSSSELPLCSVSKASILTLDLMPHSFTTWYLLSPDE